MGLWDVIAGDSEPAGSGSMEFEGNGSNVGRCEGINPKLRVCEGISLVGDGMDADGMRPVTLYRVSVVL